MDRWYTSAVICSPVRIIAFNSSLVPSATLRPLSHDHDPGAELFHLFHIVGGVDDGGSFPVQLADSLKDAASALGIHGNGGFIQKDQFGLVGDPAGNVQPSEQTAAQLLGAELPVIRQPGKHAGFFHQGAAFLFIRNVQAAEIVDVSWTVSSLKTPTSCMTTPICSLTRVVIRGHRFSEEADFPFFVGEQGENAVDGSGLAAAIGSQETEDLTLLDLQVEMVQGDQGAVSFYQIGYLNDHRWVLLLSAVFIIEKTEGKA